MYKKYRAVIITGNFFVNLLNCTLEKTDRSVYNIFIMSKGSETKERLLQMATDMMCQKGFGATSVNDLLQASGLKRGTLYYHFPGKDDLGLAVLERVRTMFFTAVDAALADADPFQGLCNFFDFALELQRKKCFVGGCLFGNLALEMSDNDSGYMTFTKKIFQEWISKIEDVVRRGQQAGKIRTDIDAVNMAQMIVSSLEGGIMLSRLGKNEQPLRNCLELLRKFVKDN